jgi:tetratricopeptide (TPR) repeat protein
MEVLPTPHSIAICALIALYSDPYSPLYPSDDTVGWPSRLSTLIQQLVREDDGYLFAKDTCSDSMQDELDEDDIFADLMNLMDNPSGAGDARKSKPKKANALNSTSIRLHTEQISKLVIRVNRAYKHTNEQTAPAQALLTKLQHATISIEHLSQLIDEFHSLLEGRGVPHHPHTNNPIGIDGDSSFGVYLRKMCLGMEELPFESMSRLWRAFGLFVDEAFESISKSSIGQEWLPSSSQVESIVKKTCLDADLHDQFGQHVRHTDFNRSSNSTANDKTSNNNPGADLLKTHPETPSLHFLLYYTSLLQNERCSTLESLHRYFDYGMIHERKERAERSLAGINTTNNSNNVTIPSGPTGGITTSVNNEQQRRPNNPNTASNTQRAYREPNIMQYAAVLLAQTYHRFGYKSLALQATQEAIRVAQQSNDEECVLFAQGWLAYIQYEDVAMLRRCRDRALERGLVTLAAGATLELGRREGYSRRVGRQDDELNEDDEGGGVCMAWDSIQNAGRASAPAGGRGLIMDGAAARGGGVGGQNVTDVENMTSFEALSILGRQNMAIAGLWDSTGHTSMASLSSRAALHGYGTELPSEDVTSTMRRILSSFSYGSGLDCLSLETSAVNQPDRSVLSTSLNALAALHEQGSASDWVQTTTTILHEQSVRSHNINIAQSLQCILANHAAFPSSPSNAVEAALISLSRSTHLLLESGDFASAKATARQACSLASKHSLLIHQGWQLLQLALIDLEASTSAPSICPSVERVLPPLLECLHLAHSIDPLRAVALSTLAKVFLSMGRFLRARALLNSAMPLVVQHGHVWFQAEACLTLAKCNLAEAKALGPNTSNSSSRTSPVTLQRGALSQLENAASLFNKIEDTQRLQQTYYLQAVIFDSIPQMQAKRDEVAQKFSQLAARRQSASKMWNAVHGILVGDPSKLLCQ